MSLDSVSMWLVHSIVFGSIILAFGSFAFLIARKPVYQVRIIGVTFAACLIVPVLQQLHVLPQYSLSLLPIQVGVLEESGVGLDGTGKDGNARFLVVDGAIGGIDMSPIGEEEPSKRSISDGSMGLDAWSSLLSPLLWRSFLFLYLTCVTCLLILSLTALMHRSLIARRARPASDRLESSLRSLVGTGTPPRLLVSAEIDSPVMWGVFKSTIVVPASIEFAEDKQIRWSLAHEWAHVRHHDFAIWTLATIVKYVCFFCPHYWWLRRQLHLGQDFLADAFASNRGESDEDYAAFLISLARVSSTPELELSLGMVGARSSLSRRVAMLVDEHSLQQEISRRASTSLAVIGSVLAIGLSLLTLENRASRKLHPGDSEKREIHADVSLSLSPDVSKSMGSDWVNDDWETVYWNPCDSEKALRDLRLFDGKATATSNTCFDSGQVCVRDNQLNLSIERKEKVLEKISYPFVSGGISIDVDDNPKIHHEDNATWEVRAQLAAGKCAVTYIGLWPVGSDSDEGGVFLQSGREKDQIRLAGVQRINEDGRPVVNVTNVFVENTREFHTYKFKAENLLGRRSFSVFVDDTLIGTVPRSNSAPMKLSLGTWIGDAETTGFVDAPESNYSGSFAAIDYIKIQKKLQLP